MGMAFSFINQTMPIKAIINLIELFRTLYRKNERTAYNMDAHQKMAAEIFRQHGLGFETDERADGWANAVWLNCDYSFSGEFGFNSL